MNPLTQALDEKAKKLAKNLLLTEGELLVVLMQMSQEKLFTQLDYSGVFDYCQRALNFSREQSFYYKKVAEVSEEVPQLKEAVVQGELSLSEARRIAPVLTVENQADWIEKAKTLKQTELDREVSIANPKARPRERIKPVAENVLELRVAIDDDTDQNLKVLTDLLSQKLKRAATLSDVIGWAAKTTREKFDPEKRAERSKKKSSGHKPHKPGRHPIPAAVRHEVVRRDGLRCSFIGKDQKQCEQKRWLDLHHVIPVSEGGLNDADNLYFLCSRHHIATHEKNLQ